MEYNKLMEADFHVIKQSILDPDSSPLSKRQQYILERLVAASKILDRYPVRRNAVLILQTKFPDLSRAQAHRDLSTAARLFNSYETDQEYWRPWLMENMVKQIRMAETKGDLKAWAAGLNLMIKALGKRPEKELDPKLIEKHTFYIHISDGEHSININTDILDKIPKKLREVLAGKLFVEIDEEKAKQIMES